MTPRPAARPPFTVFLDRDGVFDVAPKVVVRRWSGFRWLPGAKEAFARLNRPDVQTCLVTNQPFVGTGLLPRRRLQRLHAHMLDALTQAGGRLDRIEASTVPVPIPSRRRKPRAGMLEDAAAAWDQQGSPVDKERAVMVGDRLKDAQAGAAFGIPAILLATSETAERLEEKVRRAGLRHVVIAQDLGAAVDIILERLAEAAR